MPEASPSLPERPLLGGARSFTNRAWRLREASSRQVALLAQRHGLDEAVARFLAARGVSPEEVSRFLTPRLQDGLPDPSTLADMDAAVGRILQAVARRERIAVFGDYDVDGTCSAALLVGYLRGLGAEVTSYVPDRLSEGYGPNEGALDALAREGAGLVITVDCGTTAHAPLAHARRIGLDVIVLDHHKAEGTLPEAVAVVNPNRPDDGSGLGHLCAAGVVFMTLVALRRAARKAGLLAGEGPDLLAGLDLVALASVCDMVPLVGLNRAFVAQGLKVMAKGARPGLAALCEAAGITGAPEAYHLGFLLGPRINAAGRIAHAGLGLKLLLSDDPEEVKELAATLDRLNRERQEIEQQVMEEAAAVIARRSAGAEAPAVWVAAGEGWHPGVVGIAAQRLVRRLGRPVAVLSLDGQGRASGSARSIPGVDIGAAVIAAHEAGIIEKGGGHAMAAGMTVASARVAELEAFFDARFKGEVARALEARELLIDAALALGGVQPELAETLARAGPYGMGHPAPRFLLPAVRIVDAREVGNGHLRLILADAAGSRGVAIAFRAAGEPLGERLAAARGAQVHLVGQLKRNDWQGRARVDIVVEDAAPGHLPVMDQAGR